LHLRAPSSWQHHYRYQVITPPYEADYQRAGQTPVPGALSDWATILEPPASGVPGNGVILSFVMRRVCAR
jgi:hypothetical protein